MLSSELSVVSTVLVAGLWAFAIIKMVRNKKTEKWGRYIAIAALWGLLVCIFVAMRDGYDKSVQAMIGKGEAGLFTADGLQSNVCCIGGGIIALGSLLSVFIKKQGFRKAVFFTVSSVIILKTLVIELSRIFMIG